MIMRAWRVPVPAWKDGRDDLVTEDMLTAIGKAAARSLITAAQAAT